MLQFLKTEENNISKKKIADQPYGILNNTELKKIRDGFVSDYKKFVSELLKFTNLQKSLVNEHKMQIQSRFLLLSRSLKHEFSKPVNNLFDRLKLEFNKDTKVRHIIKDYEEAIEIELDKSYNKYINFSQQTSFDIRAFFERFVSDKTNINNLLKLDIHICYSVSFEKVMLRYNEVIFYEILNNLYSNFYEQMRECGHHKQGDFKIEVFRDKRNIVTLKVLDNVGGGENLKENVDLLFREGSVKSRKKDGGGNGLILIRDFLKISYSGNYNSSWEVELINDLEKSISIPLYYDRQRY